SRLSAWAARRRTRSASFSAPSTSAARAVACPSATNTSERDRTRAALSARRSRIRRGHYRRPVTVGNGTRSLFALSWRRHDVSADPTHRPAPRVSARGVGTVARPALTGHRHRGGIGPVLDADL